MQLPLKNLKIWIILLISVLRLIRDYTTENWTVVITKILEIFQVVTIIIPKLHFIEDRYHLIVIREAPPLLKQLDSVYLTDSKQLKSTMDLEDLLNLSLSQIAYIWKRKNGNLLKGTIACTGLLENSSVMDLLNLDITQGIFVYLWKNMLF